MKKEILRSEQKKEFTWDLEKIYSTIADYNQDYEQVKELTKELNSFQGHLLDSSDKLLEFLEKSEVTERLICKLGTYAVRRFDEDISNTESQTLYGKFEQLQADYLEKTSFFVPEILKVEFDTILKMIKENEKLKPYELLLKRIFRDKPYTLSEREEKILSSLQVALGTGSKVAKTICNSELQFGTILDENNQEVMLTNENYLVYNKSSNRRVRKDAFMMMYHSYEKYKETLTETFQGYIASRSTINRLRGFKNSKEASLFQNRVPVQVYNNLIDTVHKRMDVMYKYIKLKKDVLHLEDFSLYDTYLNLEPDVDKKYTYEEAKEIVLDVVQVFGDDYVSNIKRAFSERWIDVYPNKGKRGGAYSAGSYDTLPYVLLNFQGNYHDVSTLAHELGHSMHTYYSTKNNSYNYSDYKIFVAEVASTVNEMLLNYYMLEHSKDVREKRAILSEMMELFKSTIYRQTMFSEFEDYAFSTYENTGVLTNEMLCNRYYELNKQYFGNEIIVNDEIRYEWERVPHFYYNFYVYQYATGLSAACYIVNRIRNKEENAVEDYLNFLKTGDSLDPVEELQVAGVNMLDASVIDKALDMFEELIDEYRNLL